MQKKRTRSEGDDHADGSRLKRQARHKYSIKLLTTAATADHGAIDTLFRINSLRHLQRQLVRLIRLPNQFFGSIRPARRL